MPLFETYSGATRPIPILGDPIRQVKSPYGLTKGFAERGADFVVVPMEVAPDAVQTVLRALDHVRNLAGVIATVPHKFALCAHADQRTERAAFYGSANVMRRDASGRWVADMLDGLGFVRAVTQAGGRIDGARALLAGAGGAGGAIALAVLEAGADSLAVHDIDTGRRDDLIARLNTRYRGRARAGSAAIGGNDLVLNASPMGMRAGDPLPVDLAGLDPGMVFGDVVTPAGLSPLLAAAQAAGCRISSGHDMFHASVDLMLDFFTAP